MKYIDNNFEIIGKQYLYGVGGYDGTNPNTNNDVATVLSNYATTDEMNNAIQDAIQEAIINELNSNF